MRGGGGGERNDGGGARRDQILPLRRILGDAGQAPSVQDQARDGDWLELEELLLEALRAAGDALPIALALLE